MAVVILIGPSRPLVHMIAMAGVVLEVMVVFMEIYVAVIVIIQALYGMKVTAFVV